MLWLWVPLCVLALVVLFFPFKFCIDFEVDCKGATAKIFLFRKLLYTYLKKFREADEEFIPNSESGKKAEPVQHQEITPRDAKTEDKPQEKKDSEIAKSETEVDETKVAQAPSPKTEKISVEPSAESNPPAETMDDDPGDDFEDGSLSYVDTSKVKAKGSPSEASKTEVKEQGDSVASNENAEGKKEKRSLTDREFWTILLTPELDAKAFKALKKILVALLKLFRVKFVDCFVEGIRTDYLNMGYGAALNGILKSFPYVGAWDFRMDWTRDHELRAQGHIDACVNLCRLIGLILVVVWRAGIVLLSFWRRRAHVLKTNELPTLGWIRNKIVNLMAED